MKVGLMHVTPYSKADPALVAKRAEELGFDSYWVGDHTIIPQVSSVVYPGAKPDGTVPHYVSELPDPFIALARAGATTSRIKLATGICLVPERNPIVTAKQVATLDDATGGRFMFGIGAGWNPEECTILGGDFAHRWTQVKEYVAAMRVLWTEEFSEYHGKYVDFPAVKCFPKPAQRPYPPVLIGAINNPKALKRVAEWGDGWVPVVQSVAEFADGVNTIRDLARKAGRDLSKFEFIPFGLAGQWQTADEIRQLEQAGATRVVVWLDQLDLNGILGEMEQIAGRLMGRKAAAE
jgi:probable F420-dependent oxidoreductase